VKKVLFQHTARVETSRPSFLSARNGKSGFAHGQPENRSACLRWENPTGALHWPPQGFQAPVSWIRLPSHRMDHFPNDGRSDGMPGFQVLPPDHLARCWRFNATSSVGGAGESGQGVNRMGQLVTAGRPEEGQLTICRIDRRRRPRLASSIERSSLAAACKLRTLTANARNDQPRLNRPAPSAGCHPPGSSQSSHRRSAARRHSFHCGGYGQDVAPGPPMPASTATGPQTDFPISPAGGPRQPQTGQCGSARTR